MTVHAIVVLHHVRKSFVVILRFNRPASTNTARRCSTRKLPPFLQSIHSHATPRLYPPPQPTQLSPAPPLLQPTLVCIMVAVTLTCRGGGNGRYFIVTGVFIVEFALHTQYDTTKRRCNSATQGKSGNESETHSSTLLNSKAPAFSFGIHSIAIRGVWYDSACT